MIDKADAEKLAEGINMLRPDWPTKQILGVIGQHARRPIRDIALALVWLAYDLETKSPGRLAESGPWWRAASAGYAQDNAPATRNDPVHLVLARAGGSGGCEHGEPRGPGFCALCRNGKGLIADHPVRQDSENEA